MRAGRLVALLLELQHRGGATATELSRHLEVSVRTIYRDVAALQMAGVPLWTEPGPHGGVRLLDGWRTELDGLTGDEAMALALAGAPGVADDLGLGAVLLAAETKVRAVLPPELRARSERVRERFHLDAPGWFHRPEDTAVLGPLAEAVWTCRRISIRYQRGEATVVRTLEPLGIVMKAGTWYLVARHRHQVRTYRVGRIASLEVLDETFRRPERFDLASQWATSMGEFERSLLRYECRVRLSPSALRLLPTVMDPVAGQAAVDAAGPPDDDGWREATVFTESEQVAVGQLTGLGAGIEVIAPAALRRAMVEVGAEMARLNGD